MDAASLEIMVAPEVERLGFECIKAELAGSTRNPIIRLYIDKPGGVSIKDCALVSRAVGLVLDDADPFPGRYLLEVSSPGSNRPLVKESHFKRFQGHSAKVQFKENEGGKRTETGVIRSCEDNVLTLETEEGELVINVSKILKANLVGVEYEIDKKMKRNKKSKGGK